jgi:zinc transporter ZupT
MKRIIITSCFAALFAIALPAHASDFRGFLSGVATFAIGVPVALGSIALFVVLALSGSYRSKATAIWHSRVASVAPIGGLIATVIDSPTISNEEFLYLVNGAMLVLAQLPVGFYRYRHHG